MNIKSGDARLILLCPAWIQWGSVRRVKPGTVILHSRADDVIFFGDFEELVAPASALIEVGKGSPIGRPGAAGKDEEGVWPLLTLQRRKD